MNCRSLDALVIATAMLSAWLCATLNFRHRRSTTNSACLRSRRASHKSKEDWLENVIWRIQAYGKFAGFTYAQSWRKSWRRFVVMMKISHITITTNLHFQPLINHGQQNICVFEMLSWQDYQCHASLLRTLVFLPEKSLNWSRLYVLRQISSSHLQSLCALSTYSVTVLASDFSCERVFNHAS